MLIFIENTPRAYAWGSSDALPELLGAEPSGEPQAELWLGDHPSAPASVAKASPTPQTLIDLIKSDPDLYGVNGEQLPFLLKVLAIGAPLSLQVHPDKQQAEAGFAAEEEAGVPRDAHARNYGDPNHKPELLVALSEVTALCGFRPLADVRRDLLALAGAVNDDSPGGQALQRAAEYCNARGESAAAVARRSMLEWALAADSDAIHAVRAIAELFQPGSARPIEGLPAERATALEGLTAAHPGDPGVLISLFLHLVTLQPGESVYLGAQQLHAYLSGVGVEVMAASDNVLRAGLTEKYIDIAELLRIVTTETLEEPRFNRTNPQRGLVAFEPPVPDFSLRRVRLDRGENQSEDLAFDSDDEFNVAAIDRGAETLTLEAPHPMVLIATAGQVWVERVGDEYEEVACVRRGQSLYVSAGDPVELSGNGEAFLATVGEGWSRVSQP